MGILAALLDARETGEGRYIDVSMTDSLLAHSVVALSALAATGQSSMRGEDALSGELPCYNYYRTSDGRYLAVGALEAKFWYALCDSLGHPDLKAKHEVRGEEAHRVRSELQAIFGERDSTYWTDKFRDVDCCVTPVLTLDEALKSAQIQARRILVPTEHPIVGKVTQPALPLKGSGFESSTEPGSAHGRMQSDDILQALGCSSHEIESFRSAGIVG